MLTYSVAIRTLGTSGDALRRELESIRRQSVKPERVLIYIAEGYPTPDFTIGEEEYVVSPKGMATQRLRNYDEVESDVIFLLDDDVELAPDCAEKMLAAMEAHGADAIGADSFRTHLLPLKAKVKAALANMVMPHHSRKWAFRIHSNGSFSYNGNPAPRYYPSQSCAGPAFMIKKDAYKKYRLEDEAWLDLLGYPYGEDFVMTYKIYRNGGRLGVAYDAGCEHLDAGSASGAMRGSGNRIFMRTQGMAATWHRALYSCAASGRKKCLAAAAFGGKMLWQFGGMLLLSAATFSPAPVMQFIRGLKSGLKFVNTPRHKSLHPYAV